MTLTSSASFFLRQAKFTGSACAAAVLLLASSAPAQNLFVSDLVGFYIYSGNTTEITPGGAQSTFASGLNEPAGLAINNAGDLFEADLGSDNIYEFTPGGTRSTFASGVDNPNYLTFQPVPKPSALGLLAVGATALIVHRRRKLAA